jgi:CDP-3, 6-dideoxy-D-glycero-L-glycero-4-hexulose-4-reductase
LKTVVVTGGTGYIGGFLVGELLRQGLRVVVVGRSASQAYEELEGIYFISFQGVEQLIESLLPFKPDGVIHLAAFYRNDHTPADVVDLVEANILFLALVTEASVEAGAKWLVNIGSHSQLFGEANTPANLYAATKSAFQEVLRFYADARGLQVASLLLGDVYGANDTRKKILNLWRDASESSSVVGMSPGEQVVQPIHVFDVVSAITHTFSLLEDRSLESPSTYLVRGDKAVTVIELAKVFSEETERRLQLSWGARPYHHREMMALTTLIPDLPGWSASIPLEEGLKRAFGHK